MFWYLLSNLLSDLNNNIYAISHWPLLYLQCDCTSNLLLSSICFHSYHYALTIACLLLNPRISKGIYFSRYVTVTVRNDGRSFTITFHLNNWQWHFTKSRFTIKSTYIKTCPQKLQLSTCYSGEIYYKDSIFGESYVKPLFTFFLTYYDVLWNKGSYVILKDQASRR